ncbi:MAG TPA: hypoxanthine phosphoribosyltransferase [Lentisphaeria bacterium]|nr:MAG: hypoxanthine phosphoribosyltransferase [Lentisphaerae bacterium GWF2_50_93]HCE42440.1 hypoxanthine phosphoribosyltransferase [Lentisphaeria bacterium]
MKLPKPKVLISERRIRKRVAELGNQISSDYEDQDLTVIFISTGAVIFASDLVRNISLPIQIDSISASSYTGIKSSGRVKVDSRLKIDIRGKNVLIVDDILDSGRTLLKIMGALKREKPADIRICVLLDKASKRVGQIRPDYSGFSIPDVFVYGYGLDYDGYCRNLPCVAFLEK